MTELKTTLRKIGRTKYMPEILMGFGSLVASISIGLVVGLIASERFNNLAFWIVSALLFFGFGVITLSFFLARDRERGQDSKFNILISEIKGIRKDLREGRDESKNSDRKYD